MPRLPIFPEPGFDQSAMTPVLLGVVLSWFFTETFGWVFAGLVVPGYLASVFLLHPMGGVIDVIEAILTYGLARLLGEHVARTGLTSRIFGRERFFLIVVCSILVRVLVEGMLLPALLPRTPWAFSIGLVVVPLAANACWKTGLAGGVVQTAVPTLIVYALLRFVLVPYTNFSLSGFELATENVIASFLASPKAYILILTGAAVASAANVRYGWDFNGILVPALLGLVVLEPVKLLATFVEALAVFAVGSLAMRKFSLVGPRQTAAFFAIDYALRFAFAWLLGRSFPSSDPVGLMGFGYLLPTLLAVKIAQRDSVALVALPALKTSVLAFAIGTVIGYGAMRLDPAPAMAAPAEGSRPAARAPRHAADATLWVAGLGLEQVPQAARARPPWDKIVAGLLEGKHDAAVRAGLVGDALEGGVTLLRERGGEAHERYGTPAILARTARGKRIVLTVGDGAKSAEAAIVAGRLLEDGHVSAVVVGQLPLSDRAKDPEVDRAAEALRSADGVIIELDKAPSGQVRVRGRGKAAGVLRELLAPLGELAHGEEIELRAETIARLTEPRGPSVDLSSPAAVSALLEHVPGSGEVVPVEDLVVLRRWVLAPLVKNGSATEAEIAVGRHAARILGYRWTAPSERSDGSRVVALLPDGAPRSIVLIARSGAPIRRVVEVPRALGRGTRDLALRLAAAASADAVLFGLETGGSTYDRDTLRAAHGALLETATEVIVVRGSGKDREGAVGIGAWGAGGPMLELATQAALGALGISAHEEPVDAHLRETASRTLPSRAALVSVTADARAEELASMSRERDDMRTFARIGAHLEDDSVEGASERLARTLPDRPTVQLESLTKALRVAVGERSVTALGALEAELATSAANAALVSDRRSVNARRASVEVDAGAPRGEARDVIVVVARDQAGVIVLVQPTSASSGTWLEERRSRPAECARAVLAGGRWRVEGT